MVYEFKVEPDDLDEAARHIWRLAQENARAISYAQEWLQVEESGGLILTPVLDELQKVCDKLKASYERLGTITDSSSTELTNAGIMYKNTDHATAAALDRAYSAGADK
ncbi:hypothetical protein B0T36_02360 [Nocardia donostiensis]|uniref:type VII secretion target n=1 Tax=Nocardia donostiensis TaxID=1538463 RepID=UPI0009EFEDB8|nr:type VII secretion target [Nocardia donostiensis]OQS16555.1 hypothetical protein B0T36_02360 [Nocardia donostiensis]